MFLFWVLKSSTGLKHPDGNAACGQTFKGENSFPCVSLSAQEPHTCRQPCTLSKAAVKCG